METLLRDLRYAVRALARQRGFTLTVVATLALGIGVNTAMFSIVHGILLRPLPYPDDGAIVRIGEAHQGQARSNVFLTNHSMLLLQDEAESFEQLAAYRPRPFNWSSPDGVRVPFRRRRLAVAVPAAAGGAAARAALRRRGSPRGREPGHAAESSRLDHPIRV